jgi:hypothetical protein
MNIQCYPCSSHRIFHGVDVCFALLHTFDCTIRIACIKICRSSLLEYEFHFLCSIMMALMLVLCVISALYHTSYAFGVTSSGNSYRIETDGGLVFDVNRYLHRKLYPNHNIIEADHTLQSYWGYNLSIISWNTVSGFGKRNTYKFWPWVRTLVLLQSLLREYANE